MGLKQLRLLAATFWIGGLWIIGIVVAPVLFSTLNKVTAGMVAGELFVWIAWIGMVCGLILLVEHLLSHGISGLKHAEFWLVVVMLICIILNHFAITPIIVDLKQHMNQAAEGLFGGGFATWHTISSLIYLVQSLLGLLYIIKTAN